MPAITHGAPVFCPAADVPAALGFRGEAPLLRKLARVATDHLDLSLGEPGLQL